ncbi:uncharacterized protein BKCO1_1600083 [Diplodia corticola]|uniref:Uncharacterized protein n=1 Tax=Diplodia corticola TaxID=236234 RepID=A0A1J9S6T2_9PEZI|nr:uncharacterized protein BKCO1_1600083 [Diplodia corticola]OJD35644.1 hypothetical protein BKCO1_1600083 [Diplodia corticola]
MADFELKLRADAMDDSSSHVGSDAAEGHCEPPANDPEDRKSMKSDWSRDDEPLEKRLEKHRQQSEPTGSSSSKRKARPGLSAREENPAEETSSHGNTRRQWTDSLIHDHPLTFPFYASSPPAAAYQASSAIEHPQPEPSGYGGVSLPQEGSRLDRVEFRASWQRDMLRRKMRDYGLSDTDISAAQLEELTRKPMDSAEFEKYLEEVFEASGKTGPIESSGKETIEMHRARPYEGMLEVPENHSEDLFMRDRDSLRNEGGKEH